MAQSFTKKSQRFTETDHECKAFVYLCESFVHLCDTTKTTQFIFRTFSPFMWIIHQRQNCAHSGIFAR